MDRNINPMINQTKHMEPKIIKRRFNKTNCSVNIRRENDSHRNRKNEEVQSLGDRMTIFFF